MHVPLIDLKAQYEIIRKEVNAAIEGVLEKQQFILGEEVASFENEMAAFCGTQFAVACASGTDAILLSLIALEVGEGDEVITTSYSFFSTAGMIAWLKARPVFVDIDPKSYLLLTDQVAQKITAKTKAIIGVDLFGQCCAMEPLVALDIPFVEDAAQAIGAKRNGKPAGSLGKIACFSFFPTKNLGAYGDGGMITTNDAELADGVRQLRMHGEGSKKYLHKLVGTNSRLDELQAAILRAKLRYLNQWNERRNVIAQFYQEHLEDLPVVLPQTETGNIHTFHQFVIQTENRDALRSALMEQGIGSAIYYPLTLPQQPCFSSLKTGNFPNAEKCARTCLALPVFPELTEDQLEYVTRCIREFFDT